MVENLKLYGIKYICKLLSAWNNCLELVGCNFIQNCVDFWIEFEIELESDLEVSNYTEIELMY